MNYIKIFGWILAFDIHYTDFMIRMGFSEDSDSKEFVCSAGDLSLIPERREWLPTPTFLPGKSY